MTRAFLGQHTQLEERVEHVAVFALAAGSTNCRRWRHILMHILACQRLRGLTSCEDFVANWRAFLWHVARSWEVDGVGSARLDAAPFSSVTCAQFLIFATWSNFLVAGLELHAFVSAFAHRDGDAFVIFVEHLSHWTSTTFNALQSNARNSSVPSADNRQPTTSAKWKKILIKSM